MPDDPAPAPAAIDVVAGVIQDARGRILLARRTVGRDLAGLWEFPGGKREAGESPEAALARELHEELGIDADVGAPVIAVPQRYPHKRLRLDVRRVRNWRGTARGREGQALAWVPPHKLASYAMPPADRPVVAALGDPAEYLVTPAPAPGADGERWLAMLEEALGRGIRRIQLRNARADTFSSAGGAIGAPLGAGGEIADTRGHEVTVAPASDSSANESAGLTDGAAWSRLVEQAVRLCVKAGADVLVNGDPELARSCGAGLHLRAAQLHSLDGRPVPPDVPFAASCHTLEEVKAAEALGCDFAVVGNLRESPSHPGRPGIGWSGFVRLREQVAIPLYAIGGLTPPDIAEARQHGAQGIAAIRGLWPGP